MTAPRGAVFKEKRRDMSHIGNYFKEVHLELKKVNWPTRQETVRYTLIVLGVSAAVAVFLGGLDVLFQWIVRTFVL